MLVVSLLTLSLNAARAAQTYCDNNWDCKKLAYGSESEQDKCFHEDQYYMSSPYSNGEAYCWDSTCDFYMFYPPHHISCTFCQGGA